MHRIDGPGATEDNKFTEGNPSLAVPATQVTDDFLNAVQEEIAAVIEDAGLTLDKEDNTQLLQAIEAIIGSNLLPAGSMIDFAGTVAPAGYLLCNGANVSRVTYAAMFANIGITWGAGDGSTTFTLPDFRRRVAVGSGGTGTGTLGNTVGNTGGAETHALSSAENGPHTHTVRSSDGAGGSASGNASYAGSYYTDPRDSTGSSGSGSPHNNIQPSAVVLKIIKI